MFDARAATEAAAAEYPPFPFVAMDGTEHELPNPYMLNTAELKNELGLGSDADDAELDGMDPDRVLEALAPGAWAAIQAMPLVTQRRLVEAWQDHIGMEDDEQGKEPSQSSGPNRAARRSKPTSQSGASTSGRSRSGKSGAASGSS